MDQQTIDLQEKVAYLEKYVSDLDGVIRQLHDRVDQLEKDHSTLRSQFQQHLTGLHEHEIDPGEPS